MGRYVATRLLTSLGLIFLSSILIFCLMRIIPGDPTITKLGGAIQDVDPRALAAIRHQLGLDRSIPDQYVHWVWGIFHGDFGESYYSQFPVTTLISERIWATLELAIAALVLALLFVIPAATLSVIWRNGLFDGFLSGFTAIGLATPAFVSGIILIVVFGVKLQWLPTQGYVPFTSDPVESLKTVALPAITLGIVVAAPIMRVLRASLTDVGSASYIRTAAGKGLQRRDVVVKHVLPNAAIPALTTIGVVIGGLLGGAVVTEYVYARPGLGTLMVDSVYQRDYAVLQALVLLAATAFILASLVVDLLYGVIDPRLRIRAPEKGR
jgi:peptide/nickel transport system permease protein